jgi:Cu+-exporting ATPase
MVAEMLVTAGALALIAVAARFFFVGHAPTDVALTDGVQESVIVVRGGYQPATVRADAGLPLRLVFDRQEEGDCSSRVVFPPLGINRWLAPHARTSEVVVVDGPTGAAESGKPVIHEVASW